jgi:hypothetical protein
MVQGATQQQPALASLAPPLAREQSVSQQNHYLYDYLFVQMHTSVFLQSYSAKIRLTIEPIDENEMEIDLDRISYDTQFPQLRVVLERDCLENDLDFLKVFQDSQRQLNGKRCKVTVQKKYINDLLANGAKGSHNACARIVLLVYDQAFSQPQKPPLKLKADSISPAV